MEESLNKKQPEGPEGKERLKKKVLVADDDAVMRELNVTILEMMGYETEAVKDGQELMDKLAAKPGEFDLVVTDRQMPGVDGITALKSIRADEKLKHLPVIIVSGNLGDKDKREISELGGLSIDKPFKIDNFKEIVKEAVGV